MKFSFGILLSIFIGGGVGAVMRYGVGILTTTMLPQRSIFLPTSLIATLMVNVLGSFLAGLLMSSTYFKHEGIVKAFLMVGLLGALTTFSTFSVQTVLLWRDGLMIKMLINMLGNNLFSIFACALGFYIGQFCINRFV